jgi:hypothetical protein
MPRNPFMLAATILALFLAGCSGTGGTSNGGVAAPAAAPAVPSATLVILNNSGGTSLSSLTVMDGGRVVASVKRSHFVAKPLSAGKHTLGLAGNATVKVAVEAVAGTTIYLEAGNKSAGGSALLRPTLKLISNAEAKTLMATLAPPPQ